MLRATLKSLLGRKLRLALSAIAIILAVTFVSAALVLQSTLNRSFDTAFNSAFERIQLQVTAASPLGGDPGTAPPVPLDDTVVARTSGVSGVASARGEVRANGARIIGRDGRVPETSGQRIGVSWAEGSGATLTEGRAPAAPGEIVINAGLAKETGYRVGDAVGVLTMKPRQQFTVVGIATYEGRDDLVNGEQTISFALPTAQELMLGAPGAFSSIDVRLAPGADTGKVKADVRNALGDGFLVRTGTEVAHDASGPARGTFTGITYVLLGFAGVAVLVGVFLIANAFSIVVAQRTKELALLRAIGAGRGQVRRSVLLEALIVSFLSWIGGFALGLLVGRLAASALASGDDGVPIAGFQLPIAALVVSFLVGVGVTLLSALLPAARASRVAPVAAMRLTTQKERPSKVNTIIGAVLLVAGAAVIGAGLAGDAIAAVGGGALLTFVGVILVTPVLIAPVISLVGGLTRSVPARLGRLNATRHPRRTALTAVSLMIGVMLVTIVSTVLSSLQSTATHVVDANLKAELIVNSGAVSAGSVPPTINPESLRRMRELPDVAAVAGYAFEPAKVNGKDDYVLSWDDVSALTKIASVQFVAGGLSTDKVLLNEGTAKRLDAKTGDQLTVQLGRGEERTLEVGGVFGDTQVADGIVLPWSFASTGFRTDQPNQAYVKLREGAPLTATKSEVVALLRDNPEVEVRTRSELIDQAGSAIGLIVAVVQVLLAVAMIIAILGVVNTLVLAVLERTNEFGMLRAIGMYRGDVRRMIMVESVVMSLFGAVLGVVLGAGLGLALVQALKSQGINQMALPWQLMLVYVVAAAVVGVLAALAPAGRAAKLNILAAVRHA
ncbi:ABC transporter permease [Micromonospora tarensis]|uniref:ABC transporter permease n=1 Tax=Micromonospora tarensis TaxID=2806100 RepID=A0ABS1YAP1_9ACTN|nr:ABC transporter permease [Micromonospora tarensis]MBM0274438.1 ABC transporter permease [Micromonospora tarensis]